MAVSHDPNFAPDAIRDIVWTKFKRCDRESHKNLKLVCRRFYGILKDPLLWIDVRERNGKISAALRDAVSKLPHTEENTDVYFDYEKIWMHNIYRANIAPPLLDRPTTVEDVMKNRCVQIDDRSIGDLTVEEPPVGCELRTDIPRCFTTSHTWASRRVTIDLTQCGVQPWILDTLRPRIIISEYAAPRRDCGSIYEPWILDKLRPRIIISEYAAPRRDCGSIYEMSVELLKEDERFHDAIEEKKTENRRKEARNTWPQWSPAKWEKVKIIFEDYPAGVRSIAVESAGKDTQWWSGFYGSKFAKFEIRVELPSEMRQLPLTIFPSEENHEDEDIEESDIAKRQRMH